MANIARMNREFLSAKAGLRQLSRESLDFSFYKGILPLNAFFCCRVIEITI